MLASPIPVTESVMCSEWMMHVSTREKFLHELALRARSMCILGASTAHTHYGASRNHQYSIRQKKGDFLVTMRTA